MPYYLVMCVRLRRGDYLLRLTRTGKDRYKWLAMKHLSDHIRMPESKVDILARMTSAGWEDHPFANIVLDECMEVFNRIIKQALHRIPPKHIMK